jgi:hypothetical protein
MKNIGTLTIALASAVRIHPALGLDPSGTTHNLYVEFDEIYLQELQEYAQAYWAHFDDPTNYPMPEPIFSFHTTSEFDPFGFTSAVLSEVYADRIVDTPGGTANYYLEDLMQDDPSVFAAFRLHTETGILSTPLADLICDNPAPGLVRTGIRRLGHN